MREGERQPKSDGTLPGIGGDGQAETVPTAAPPDRAQTLPAPPAESTLPAPPAESTLPQAETLVGPHTVADMPSLPRVDDGAYAIGHEIARGGMGRILFARDRKLRRDVVIKVMRRESARVDPRFEREAFITARLQHPSIVRVYDAGVLRDGQAFYAMERVRGRSLEVVLGEATTLRARLALLPHAIAVADAIAYAHSEGVLHRDLKPSNVLIGPFGETVVIDWGLAKDLRVGEPAPAADGGAPSDSSLTQHGAVMGTPSFMAPEQARGEAADERTDIYALGALLYAVLTGAPPHRGSSNEAVIEQVANGRRPPVLERERELPAELAAIVEHAMAHAPADRFASAKDLADELRSFAAGKLVASHSYSTRDLIRRWLARHRVVVAVSAAALVVVALVGILAIQNVMHERDVAKQARRDTEREHDKLIYEQAREALPADPSLAAAWLEHASDSALASDEVYTLASEAAQRGLAQELRGHKEDVELIAVSPDGTHVVTGSDDGTARYWNLADRTFVELRGHTGPIETFVLSSDGHYLATGGTDHSVWLWELPTGLGRKLDGHTNGLRGVAFSPDNRQLATTGEEGGLWLWDVSSGTGRQLYQHHHALRPVVWLDDHTLIVGSFDGMLGRFDTIGAPPTITQAHKAELRCLALSPDRKYLVAGDEDGLATLWSTDFKRLRTLGRHTDVVREVMFTPDGRRVISAGGDALVRVYSLGDGKMEELAGNRNGIKDIALSPDGQWVASAGIDKSVHVWSIDGAVSLAFLGHSAAVKAVGFAADGQLVSGSEDDVARVWQLAPPARPPRGAALRNWLQAHTNVKR